MGDPFNPLLQLPGEYELGLIIRAAVDHDADKERMYLTCSVGELAQRIARQTTIKKEVQNGSTLSVPVTGAAPVEASAGVAQRDELSGPDWLESVVATMLFEAGVRYTTNFLPLARRIIATVRGASPELGAELTEKREASPRSPAPEPPATGRYDEIAADLQNMVVLVRTSESCIVRGRKASSPRQLQADYEELLDRAASALREAQQQSVGWYGVSQAELIALDIAATETGSAILRLMHAEMTKAGRRVYVQPEAQQRIAYLEGKPPSSTYTNDDNPITNGWAGL